jgi:hypothetical protein
VVVYLGETITSTIYDVDGIIVYQATFTNNTPSNIFWPGYVHVPAVNGREEVTITGPFGNFNFTYQVNDWTSGICFNDGRINNRPERDLAAPVVIYVRTERVEGYNAVEVYDIDEIAATGTLAIVATEAELADAQAQALAAGTNVTVEQVGDIILSVLSSSTAESRICQVNAVDQQNNPYVFIWQCNA